MKPISIHIPEEWKTLKKEHGWTWREVLGLGIRAKAENPQLLSRIRELEEGNIKLQSKLTFYASRTAELEEKLRQVGK